MRASVGFAAYRSVLSLYLSDIAARNCLIDEAQRLVKISDFGLSGIGAQILDCKKAAPIRW